MIWRRRATGARNKPESQAAQGGDLSYRTNRRHRSSRRNRPALPAYLLGLATAFLLILNTGAAPYPKYDLPLPSSVRIHAGLMTSLVEAAFRTHGSEEEEFFCLIGTVDHENVYWITGAMRPQQRAESFRTWYKKAAVVFHASCPEGSLADLHTHPWVSDIARLMSEQDKRAASMVPYHTHIILFPGPNGAIYATTWVRQPDGSFKTVGQR
jgi:hypothetical protein